MSGTTALSAEKAEALMAAAEEARKNAYAPYSGFAVAMGLTRPTAAAVAGPDGVFCPPCGACRQFLAEFNGAMPVAVKDAGGFRVLSLEELLPSGFSLKGE